MRFLVVAAAVRRYRQNRISEAAASAKRAPLETDQVDGPRIPDPTRNVRRRGLH